MADFTGVSLNRGLSPNFFNNALQSLSYISNIQRIRLSVNHAQNDLPNIMSKARNFQSGFWYWDGIPWFGHRVLWSRWRWHGSMPPLSLLEAARDGHVVDYLRGTVGPDLWYVLSVLFLTPAFFFIWRAIFLPLIAINIIAFSHSVDYSKSHFWDRIEDDRTLYRDQWFKAIG